MRSYIARLHSSACVLAYEGYSLVLVLLMGRLDLSPTDLLFYFSLLPEVLRYYRV